MSKLEITHSENQLLAGGSGRLEFKLYYEQGYEGYRVQFTLSCHHIPLESTVGFRSDKLGPTPPIFLSPTPVSISPRFVTGIVSEVPANYSAEITYYVAFSQKPPADASIVFQAAIIA